MNTSTGDENINTVENLQKLCSITNELFDKITNKNALALLGITDAGKTTLALNIAGGIQKVIHDSDIDKYSVIAKNEYKNVVIGNNDNAGTTIPNIFNIEAGKNDGTRNYSLIDFPGFNEKLKGPIQELANSNYLFSTLKLNLGLKFLVVVAATSFTTKNGEFEQVFSHFASIFKNINALKDSVCLVVTNVEERNNTDVYWNRLKKIKDDFFRTVKDLELKQKCKDIASFILDRKAVSIIKIPKILNDETGESAFEQPNHLFEVYNGLSYCNLKPDDINIVFSEEAFKMSKELFDTNKYGLNSLLLDIEKVFKDKSEEAIGHENILPGIEIGLNDNEIELYSPEFGGIEEKAVSTTNDTNNFEGINKNYINVNPEITPGNKPIKQKKINKNIESKETSLNDIKSNCMKSTSSNNNYSLLEFNEILALNELITFILKNETYANLDDLKTKIEGLFIALYQNCSKNETKKKEYKDSAKKIYDQIHNIQFLEVFHKDEFNFGQINEAFSALKKIFVTATVKGFKYMLGKAEKNLKICNVAIDILNQENFKTNDTKENLSICKMFLGNFCLDSKNYKEAVEYYKEAIELNKEIKNIEAIYEKISVILLNSNDLILPLLKFTNVIKNVFDSFQTKFKNGCLFTCEEHFKKITKANLQEIGDGISPLSIQLINDLHYICIQISKIPSMDISSNIGNLLKIFMDCFNKSTTSTVLGEYFELTLLYKELELKANRLNFLNENLEKAKNEEINSWKKNFEGVFLSLKVELIKRIEEINISPKLKYQNYLDQIIKLCELIPNSEKSLILRSEALYLKGMYYLDLKASDQSIKLPMIKQLFSDGLIFNPGNDKIIAQLAELEKEDEKYMAAYQNYKLVHDFLNAKECLLILIKNDPKNYSPKVDLGDFYVEFGLVELGKETYLEAMSAKNVNTNIKRFLYGKINDAEIRAEVSKKKAKGFADGSISLFPTLKKINEETELILKIDSEPNDAIKPLKA